MLRKPEMNRMATQNRIQAPARQPGNQAERLAARRARYKGMTPAEIIRNMPNAELARCAKRGAEMAIYELGYRLNAPAKYNDNCCQRSEFERTCMIEADMEMAGGI